jgi:hypothetical protein
LACVEAALDYGQYPLVVRMAVLDVLRASAASAHHIYDLQPVASAEHTHDRRMAAQEPSGHPYRI